jgi:hypothetical protein
MNYIYAISVFHSEFALELFGKVVSAANIRTEE